MMVAKKDQKKVAQWVVLRVGTMADLRVETMVE